MQKLIIDTNILVSALISNTIPSKIFYDIVLREKVEICLSTEIFAEYVDVLNRDKFSKYINFMVKADIVLNRLREISKFYYPTEKVDVLTDMSDNKFLELAAESTADYLITGNTLDFKIKEFEYTRIVTAKEYWDLVQGGEML